LFNRRHHLPGSSRLLRWLRVRFVGHSLPTNPSTEHARRFLNSLITLNVPPHPIVVGFLQNRDTHDAETGVTAKNRVYTPPSQDVNRVYGVSGAS
jgi:hypothetical protein